MKMNMSGSSSKFVGLLEKNCQWIALSLGVIWLMFIAFTYWVSKPVAIKVDEQLLSPHEIDDYIAEGPVKELYDAMSKPSIPQEIRKITREAEIPNYASAYTKEMSGLKIAAGPNQSTSGGATGPLGGIDVPVEPPKPLATLPDIKPSTIAFAGYTSGISMIQKVDPKLNNPNAPATPGGKGALIPGLNGQPVDPAVALGAPPVEVAWITIEAQLLMQELTDAFAAAKIPADSASTQILQVELIREEQLSDGSFGNRTVIAPLPTLEKLPFPPKLEEEGAYLAWAGGHIVELINPAFHTVVRGSNWRNFSTKEVIEPVNVQPVVFDPATVKDISKLTPEERKLWNEWKKAKDAEEREKQKQKIPVRPATPGKGPGASAKTDRLPFAAPPLPTDQPIAPRAGEMRGDGGRPAVGSPAVGSPNPANPDQSQPNPTAEAGVFNPTKISDVTIWAHDDTAMPGHTYRYKIIVSFRNPLFATQNLALDEKNTKILALANKEAKTEWSPPVTAPKKFDFFAVASTGGSNVHNGKIKFDYFYWQDGFWKVKQLNLQPGDAIGQSGWVIGDLRQIYGLSSDNLSAIIVNDTGETKIRTIRADKADPEYAKLTTMVAKSADPNDPNAQPGLNLGTPPPIVPPTGTGVRPAAGAAGLR